MIGMGRGFHCVVPVRIGPIWFRLTVDTGAARSLVRTSFAEQLRKSPKTQKAVVPRGKADREITCVGMCEGMESNVISHVPRLACTFEEVPDGSGLPRAVTLEVDFGELDAASDVLLLGFPQILQWGIAFGHDDDGHGWMEIRKFGLTAPIEPIWSGTPID